MILKICLEMTTFRYFLKHFILLFSLHYVLLSVLWSEILGILWSHVSFQRGKKAPFISPLLGCTFVIWDCIHLGGLISCIPSPSRTAFLLIELGILKLVVLHGQFRALCLASMSSRMLYIWAGNRGIFNWISNVWRISFLWWCLFLS